MKESTALEILKTAILLERRGKAFYETVAAQAPTPAVKRLFETMAGEEEKHIEALSEQYRAHQRGASFTPVLREDRASGALSTAVLTERLKTEISAAGFEAAAIGAAMSMEREAIRVYSERARAATDPEEKGLYLWLLGWENEHLDFLVKVDREVTEAVWYDNRFWPL